MAKPTTILAISSSVTTGHVGLSAIVPVLNALQLNAIALPTVVLSNHPGFPHTAGTRIEPKTLSAMLDALDSNGMLDHITTILSGYLPTAAHVDFVSAVIDRLQKRQPHLLYICDPILGDDPKGLYIDPAAAAAIRDQLVPRADILLPNRFELSWLTGHDITSPETALQAARRLHQGRIIAKSIPVGSGDREALTILDITAEVATPATDAPAIYTVPKQQGVPNGTGDVFSALIASGMALPATLAALDSLIKHSLSSDHLQIAATQRQWTSAAQTATQSSPIASNRPATPHPVERTHVAGADGCPGGWIVVAHPRDQPGLATCQIFPTFAELVRALSHCAAIAIDIPIGLPDSVTTGGRTADREARAVLGARQSSIFAVPARPAVSCADYRDACAAALAHSDPPRMVSKQAFNLFPKIREVDDHMTPDLQARVIECHPEVAFWAMNDRQPLSQPKKVKSRPFDSGLELRRQLLLQQGYNPAFLAGPDCLRRIAAPDDFLDACAAAWTASRVAAGIAGRFPINPPTDKRGLRMEITF